MLTPALAVLPERVRLTVHGDSEFRARELFTWLRQRHCDAMLGVYGNTYVGMTADGPRQMFGGVAAGHRNEEGLWTYQTW